MPPPSPPHWLLAPIHPPTWYDFLRVEHLALQLHQGGNQRHNLPRSLQVNMNSNTEVAVAAPQLLQPRQHGAGSEWRVVVEADLANVAAQAAAA